MPTFHTKYGRLSVQDLSTRINNSQEVTKPQLDLVSANIKDTKGFRPFFLWGILINV